MNTIFQGVDPHDLHITASPWSAHVYYNHAAADNPLLRRMHVDNLTSHNVCASCYGKLAYKPMQRSLELCHKCVKQHKRCVSEADGTETCRRPSSTTTATSVVLLPDLED